MILECAIPNLKQGMRLRKMRKKAAASDCKSQPITLILAPVAGSNDPATGVNSS